MDSLCRQTRKPSAPPIKQNAVSAAAGQVTGVWQLNLTVPDTVGAYELFKLKVGGVQVGQDPFVIWVR